MQVWFVSGWQVKLCDPLVTHGPYMSAFEVIHDKSLYRFMWTLIYKKKLTNSIHNPKADFNHKPIN